MKKRISVSIIMGSESDLETMKSAPEIFERFKVPFEVEIVSAHRSPLKMVKYAQDAYSRGIQVIIAGAGGAAHLPGMVASLTTLPVIGVPIVSGPLQGLDSLLSIVQMPKGIPVATVAIDNSQNAALLALRILALQDSRINKLLLEEEQNMNEKVSLMNRNLRKKLTK